MYLDKIPPHDLDAEEAILGSMLLDPEAMGRVANLLKPDDFYREKNKWVYEACLTVHSVGGQVNLITAAHELGRGERLKAAGGIDFLSDLVSRTPTSVGVEDYARVVHRMATFRKLIAASNQIAQMGYEAPPNMEETLDKARELIEAVRPEDTLSRRITVTNPRIVETNPIRFECTVVAANGVSADFHFSVGEVLVWKKWVVQAADKLKVIPLKINNFDRFVSNLLQHAVRIAASFDASEEEQFKMLVRRWLDRCPPMESPEPPDMDDGQYIIKDVKGKSCYCFRSAPFINWVEIKMRRKMDPENLWVHLLHWGAPEPSDRSGHSVRINHKDKMRLWVLPVNFDEVPDYGETEELRRQDDEELLELL